MAAGSELDLLECLEKASMFLNNISVQMIKVFDNKNSAFTDEKEMFEICDDLFSSSQQMLSNTIH